MYKIWGSFEMEEKKNLRQVLNFMEKKKFEES
jgi:hypothetical protein